MWWIIFAVALLAVLYYKPKALVFILAGAAVLWGGIYSWTRHQEQERASISLTVAYSPDSCPAAKPLRVVFTNTSSKTLERITFSINARLPGYSSMVTPYTYKQYASDKIMQPGESFNACYAEPNRAKKVNGAPISSKELEWSATADNVYFQ